MQDLTWFIKNKLGFSKYEGHKKFSRPLNDGKKIYYDLWSWDWIYTYVYEYHLGETDIKGHSLLLSLIQVSDNGYIGHLPCDNEPKPISFDLVEDSDSKLIFYLSVKNNGKEDFVWDTDKVIFEHAKIDIPIKIEEQSQIQIVYPVSISKFIDDQSTMSVLREFDKYCKKEIGFSIMNDD